MSMLNRTTMLRFANAVRYAPEIQQEENSTTVKILKTKKEVPTVIEYNGLRYVLDTKTSPKESGGYQMNIDDDMIARLIFAIQIAMDLSHHHRDEYLENNNIGMSHFYDTICLEFVDLLETFDSQPIREYKPLAVNEF